LSTANELGRGPLLSGSEGWILAGDLTGEVIRGAIRQLLLDREMWAGRTWIIGILPRIEHTPHVGLNGSCQCPNYRIHLSLLFGMFLHVRIQLVKSLHVRSIPIIILMNGLT
jgi:hypothetical protein